MADKISLILARKLGGKKGFFAAKAGLLEAKNHVREGVLNALLYGKAAGGGGTDTTVTGSLPLTLADALAKPIISLTREGKVEQRNLPQGFTELEYIESDGNQYIDTLRKATQTSRIECEWMYPAASSASGSGRVFGSRYNSGTNRHACAIGTNTGAALTSTNVFGVFGSSGTGMLDSNAVQIDHWYSASIDINGLTLDGTLIPAPASDDFETPYTIKLFTFGQSAPGGDESTTPRGIVRMRKYRQYDDGVLVLDLRPAKRLSDNAIGKYDTVSGQFFVNEGTGAFTAGSALAPTPDRPMDLWCNNGKLKARHESGLPLGYQLLSSLTGDGRCLINTEIVLQEGDEVDLDYTIDNPQPSTLPADRFVLGTANVDTSKGGTWVEVYSSTGDISSPIWYARFGSPSSTNGTLPASTLSGHMTLKQGELVVNGAAVLYPYYVGTFQTTPLTLFGRYDADQVGYKGAKMTASLLTVKNGNTYRFRGVMAKRLSDNALGVYDLVSGTFRENLGDGTFTAGSAVADPVEIYTDGTPEVLTVTGKNILSNVPYKVGYYIDASGVERVATTDPETYLIRQASVKPSTQYTLSYTGNSTSYTQRWHAYDKDGNWLSQITYNIPTSIGERVTYPFTTPANCYYVRQGGRSQEDYQVELGGTATAYEPYTAQTVSVPDLFAVADYKDADEIINGLLTHKVGIKVLDGTEDIGKSGTYAGSFFIRNVVSGWGTFNNAPLLCTRLASVTSSSDYAVGKCMVLNGALNLWLWDDNTHQIADAQAELASARASGNPYIILYPLATETTEQTTPQPLTTAKGTNVVSSENNVPPVSATVVYKKR